MARKRDHSSQEQNGDREFGAPPGERPEEGDDDPVPGAGAEDATDQNEDREAAPSNGSTPRNDATTEARKPKKTSDEKRANFNRLASGRVSRAIDALSSLLHLANTASYDWTDEAKDKIFSTLRDKVDTVEASFVAAKTPTDGKRKSSKQLSFLVDL